MMMERQILLKPISKILQYVYLFFSGFVLGRMFYKTERQKYYLFKKQLDIRVDMVMIDKFENDGRGYSKTLCFDLAGAETKSSL